MHAALGTDNVMRDLPVKAAVGSTAGLVKEWVNAGRFDMDSNHDAQ